MTYQEKLKSPQWQKKRLEILERDFWSCQICNDIKSELHVHHLIYINRVDPWDYEDKHLMTLCSAHHDLIHFVKIPADHLVLWRDNKSKFPTQTRDKLMLLFIEFIANIIFRRSKGIKLEMV